VAVAADTHQRYAEIFRDVEKLIDDHSKSLPLFSLPSNPISRS
jgi:IMP and pyridine-specific 5'-nucleotidase